MIKYSFVFYSMLKIDKSKSLFHTYIIFDFPFMANLHFDWVTCKKNYVFTLMIKSSYII